MHSHLHDPDIVCPVYLRVFAQFLPEGGHAPLKVLSLSSILGVHVRLCSMLSLGSLRKEDVESRRYTS